MSTFGDLGTKGGLEKLNDHLKTHSYIQGYQASQLDGSILGQIKSVPNAKDFPYLNRWYNHIKSFGSDISKLPAAAGAEQNGCDRVAKPAADDDDDVDLFASDGEEDEEAAKVREQRLQEYADKKSKKGAGPIAKSSVILDVKPWDDETNMKDIEDNVRSIQMDGLVWGACGV